ncbi:unnamed protein product [Heterosigma akashiwo]|mmetsp:Transcript_40730/g.71170  ORF Transcript_40730/g.71170 Transcript_40730/m.71170 type:complete len:131 (-) Transcript_40730:531-923(-)
MKLFFLIFLAVACVFTHAFTIKSQAPVMKMDLPKIDFAPKAALASLAAAIPSSVYAAVEQADDYEYGAVNAPGWILPVGAFVVIATAAVPIFLQSGQEAFDDISDKSKDQWAGGRFSDSDDYEDPLSRKK